MELWIYPLIVFAVATAASYFWGRRKNRWIAGWIAKESEGALKPEDTTYVNIGGTIGYNFIYVLGKPFREAKGTFTLLPRQSLLYYPFSLLFVRHDRYYLQIYLSRRLLGEGHILEKRYYHKIGPTMTKVQWVNREELTFGNITYVLLWDNRVLGEKLKGFVQKMAPYGQELIHFCCYPKNENFYFYLKPVKGRLKILLETGKNGLDQFFVPS